MNFAIAMLTKKTTDIGKMNRIMKETNEWRKQYTDAIKKKDKARIEELKKKQAYVNKMSMEMQQQQMRPNVYLYDSVISALDFCISDYFWQGTLLSPIHIPWIICMNQNVQDR